MVCITNELSGSDGDIFSHTYKLAGLGPLIGTRTWGGVVGIWPQLSLVDGTITTQPEYGTWFTDVGYGVENYGTDPDLEVVIRPQDYGADRDPQLTAGVRELMKIIKAREPLLPDFGPRPSVKPPTLD
jgi:tricorn protease